MIDVSIVIINFNTFALTCDCIASIYEKTSGVSFEIILVDNASAERNPDEFKTRFPEITLIKSSTNRGFAGGNNLGIQHSSARNILLLNSDTTLRNNAVQLAVQKLDKDSTIGALTCKLLYPDNRVQPVAGRFPSFKRELRDFLRLNKRLTKQQRAEIYLGTEFDYQTEKEVDWIWGAFFMFPAKVLDIFSNKLLPTDYFMYMEDVLWCYQIRQAGFRIVYSPEPEVYHFIAGSSKDAHSDVFKRYASKILPNEYDFIRKTHGAFYCTAYYLIKALNHLSLRTSGDLVKSRTFFSLAFRGR
jgi:GT2 family glycosyltransferase